MSFISQLRAAKAAASSPPTDPWRKSLAELKGHKVGPGVMRISSRQIFQALGILPADKARAAPRIAQGMRALGWSPSFLGPRNARERGYIRRDYDIAPDEGAKTRQEGFV
jgi:hypothetical protein